MRYRYCMTCGAAYGCDAAKRHPDALVCRACGAVFYRNAKPTAGAVVVQDGRILLTRRAHDPGAGLWDLPGGFLDHWEHPEDAVVREIAEETGLEVRVTALIGMYVDAYGRDNEPDLDAILNIYYEVTVESGEAVAADDVAELVWVAPLEVPEDGWAFTHSPRVVADWKRIRGV